MITYTKQVTEALDKVQQAEQDGNLDLAIAHTKQLLSYFYMYIRELEIKKLEGNK